MNTEDDIFNIYRIFLALKRGIKIIVICGATFLLLALTYVSITKSKYTAFASILLDRTQADTVAELSATNARRSFENAAIESQLEIIKSRRVVLQAITYLFSEADRKALEQDFEDQENLIAKLQKNLNVRRVGESHVITIRYTDNDPKAAADRANAFAQAYIYDQVNFFSQDSLKTASWFQNKIKSQREKSIKATRAVQKFRIENDLIDANGRTINEQRVVDMNEQLSNAKRTTALTKVRYDLSKKIVDEGNVTAAVAEAFDNDLINSIRSRYIDNQARLSQLIRTLGKNHDAVRNQRKILEESRTVMFEEMKRIVQSRRNEFEVALAEEKALEKNLSDVIELKVQNDSKKFELEALEKEAETHQNLYEEFLEKYQTINQQQSFPVSQSRIITYAVPPLDRSHPKVAIILGIALILGTGIGVFLALLKDNFDTTIKRAGQVESTLGLFFMGFLPKVSLKSARANNTEDSSLFQSQAYKQAIESPRSLHADTSRNVKLRIDKKIPANESKVIGVVSDVPHHGKSLTASNLALYIAQTNPACLLIDADVNNPILSHENKLKKSEDPDLTANKNLSFKDLLLSDPQTNLFVLPSSANNPLNEKDLKRLIEEARNIFDYIIVDLPPLSVSSDTASLVNVIQSFLVALEWGKTLPNRLNFHLKQSGIEHNSIVGAIITETDMKEMAENYQHAIHSEYVSVT